MKFINVIRILLMFTLFILIIGWSTGAYSSPGLAGDLNHLIVGIAFFTVFVANIIAFILDKNYKEIAKRVTLFSIGVFIIVLSIPYLAEFLVEL